MKKQWRKGKLKDKDLFKGSYRELLFYSELEYTQYQDFRMRYIYFAFNSGNFFLIRSVVSKVLGHRPQLLVPQNVCHAAIPASSSACRSQLLAFFSFSNWVVLCGDARSTLTQTCISWLPGASWGSAGPGSCYRVLEIWDKKLFILWFQEGNCWICLSFLMLPGMPQTFVRLIQAYFY